MNIGKLSAIPPLTAQGESEMKHHCHFKAPEDWRSPKRKAFASDSRTARSVLDCGGPPPLLHCDMERRGFRLRSCRAVTRQAALERWVAYMSGHIIRQAREQDCAEVARLASQLGYPVSDDAMRMRLKRLLASSSDVVFVAESADDGLIGWIHGVLSQFVESDYRVEIGGLVVDERFQRKGVGRDLVERVEGWAVEHGVGQASVRCRTTRTGSHRFYERLGYSQTKTQLVFRKSLVQLPGTALEPKAEAG
jgi:GNAT superfamily N-acetyltransferase